MPPIEGKRLALGDEDAGARQPPPLGDVEHVTTRADRGVAGAVQVWRVEVDGGARDRGEVAEVAAVDLDAFPREPIEAVDAVGDRGGLGDAARPVRCRLLHRSARPRSARRARLKAARMEGLRVCPAKPSTAVRVGVLGARAGGPRPQVAVPPDRDRRSCSRLKPEVLRDPSHGLEGWRHRRQPVPQLDGVAVGPVVPEDVCDGDPVATVPQHLPHVAPRAGVDEDYVIRHTPPSQEGGDLLGPTPFRAHVPGERLNRPTRERAERDRGGTSAQLDEGGHGSPAAAARPSNSGIGATGPGPGCDSRRTGAGAGARGPSTRPSHAAPARIMAICRSFAGPNRRIVMTISSISCGLHFAFWSAPFPTIPQCPSS